MYEDPSSSQLISAGLWLREQRERRNVSPRDLAQRLGLTFRQLAGGYEAGRTRVPPELYRPWAKALGIEPRLFARTMLGFYEPITHDLLFGPTDDMAEMPANDHAGDP